RIFRTERDGKTSGNIGFVGFKDREHLSSSSKPGFQALFEARCSRHYPDRILPVYSADGPRPRGATAARNAQTGAVMTGSQLTVKKCEPSASVPMPDACAAGAPG